jgi:pantoate--beta-alanine ligase
MRICERSSEVRAWTEAYRRSGLSVGLVPTLGALHAGHRALLDRARAECERVVASVYLNPTQFDSPEDLEKYPSAPEADAELCRDAGVDLLWLGRRDDLLPEGFQTWVEVERLTRRLCGATRPGHFRGVATVVTQLFEVVRPHRAYFGLKDYQQARAVARMAADLHFDLEVRCVPTVREADGLAASSRNRRLAPRERAAAAAIYRALEAARQRILAGERSAAAVVEHLRAELSREPLLGVEYAEVVDGATLEPFARGEIDLSGGGALVAVAVRAGAVRLIDNVLVES